MKDWLLAFAALGFIVWFINHLTSHTGIKEQLHIAQQTLSSDKRMDSLNKEKQKNHDMQKLIVVLLLALGMILLFIIFGKK